MIVRPDTSGRTRTPVDFVVVNADDFGLSTEVNRAVIHALENGSATAATVMPTMPGFEEACALARDRGLDDRLGVHVSLTAGHALTSAIRACPRLCHLDGSFVAEGPPAWRLRADERRAVVAEVAAQVSALSAQGITPSHVDSHHHVHTRWAVLSCVLHAVRASGVTAVRLSRNCGPGLSGPKRLYKARLNTRIRVAGLAVTRRFGSAADAAGIRPGGGPLEVMVHPSLDPAGRLIDGTRGGSLLVHTQLAWPAFRPVTFRELIQLRDG